MRARPATLAVCAALALASATTVAGADEPSATLLLQGHRFTPDRVEVPANAKVRLVIRNADPTAEEFDSAQLHREKVVPAGGEAVVYVGPLPPGAYAFMGEFHAETARGTLIAR